MTEPKKPRKKYKPHFEKKKTYKGVWFEGEFVAEPEKKIYKRTCLGEGCKNEFETDNIGNRICKSCLRSDLYSSGY